MRAGEEGAAPLGEIGPAETVEPMEDARCAISSAPLRVEDR